MNRRSQLEGRVHFFSGRVVYGWSTSPRLTEGKYYGEPKGIIRPLVGCRDLVRLLEMHELPLNEDVSVQRLSSIR